MITTKRGGIGSKTGSTPFKWNAAAGCQHVPFTGLYHVGAREYDPRTARWLQRDPIGIAPGDPNVYRYCGNDPINLADPDGTRPLTELDRQTLCRSELSCGQLTIWEIRLSAKMVVSNIIGSGLSDKARTSATCLLLLPI